MDKRRKELIQMLDHLEEYAGNAGLSTRIMDNIQECKADARRTDVDEERLREEIDDLFKSIEKKNGSGKGENTSSEKEEVLANIDGFTSLNEEKLTGYLQEYHNQFLYQKTGFILYPYRDKLGLSHSFFEMCQSKTGKSKRYLTKEFTNGTYIKEWKLVVPDEIYKLKNGAFQDDRI